MVFLLQWYFQAGAKNMLPPRFVLLTFFERICGSRQQVPTGMNALLAQRSQHFFQPGVRPLRAAGFVR
jgi:hypothetical protein